MTVLSWITAVASLVGVVLNIHRHIACFVIWAFTNALWCVIDVFYGIPAQAALHGIYCLLALYGLHTWGPPQEDPVP